MKKRTAFILKALAFIFVAVLLWIANGFFGNPISKFIANKSAEGYIEKTYPEMGLEVEGAVYDFKAGEYNVAIKSMTSIDTNFSIDISLIGKIKRDSYQDYVLSGFNTWERINRDYKSTAEEIFESKDFIYKSDIHYGEIKIKETKSKDLFGPTYGLRPEELERDKIYDIREIGREAGHLVVYIENEDLNLERASEILIDIKRIFDKKDLPFHSIDLSMQRSGNKSGDKETFEIREFPYKEIYKEGLSERVEKTTSQLEEYYKRLDREK